VSSHNAKSEVHEPVQNHRISHRNNLINDPRRRKEEERLALEERSPLPKCQVQRQQTKTRRRQDGDDSLASGRTNKDPQEAAKLVPGRALLLAQFRCRCSVSFQAVFRLRLRHFCLVSVLGIRKGEGGGGGGEVAVVL